MPAFNGRHLQQQIRGFLFFFIQLHMLMYLLFLHLPQQPPQATPPPLAIQRPRRRCQDQAMATTERGEGGLPQHYG